ncbi:hypothetical protein GCM10007856_15360 [Azospirillum oryzae]|nr:hypothetical protein GCM10007856_15360 [Azospirillum oryzae]
MDGRSRDNSLDKPLVTHPDALRLHNPYAGPSITDRPGRASGHRGSRTPRLTDGQGSVRPSADQTSTIEIGAIQTGANQTGIGFSAM